jgi:hypothetical protein
VTQLEQFLFEEACRLEQAAALTGRAREFLKEQRVLEPAEFRIARIVGEQRARAREHIFERVAASVPNGLAGRLEDLLVVKPDGSSSGLQAIKANRSKPSVDAMLTLLDKLRVIEGTGVLGVDLLWLNGNYQRALFHQVRKSSLLTPRAYPGPKRARRTTLPPAAIHPGSLRRSLLILPLLKVWSAWLNCPPKAMTHVDTNLLIASIDPSTNTAQLWPLLRVSGDYGRRKVAVDPSWILSRHRKYRCRARWGGA